MSFQWFPFYADAYTGDTAHLTCEEHGAYLQLMLAYYRSEKPLPNTDRALSSIVKLPMDRWLECKPTLAQFFRNEAGFWHHDRIEDEMKERRAKHAVSTTRAKAGAAAMHSKRTSRAEPKASKEPAHLHLHKQESLSVLDVTVEKDNSGDNLPTELEEESDQESLGTTINPQFWPCENHITVCRIDGADEETIKREVHGFIATHQERGTFSHDWDASWTMWWKRWRDHRDKEAAKKPKPRIEVSKTIDWDAHAKRWAGGMGWPRGVGADPTSRACVCPAEVLGRHGVDPLTGLVVNFSEKV